MSWISVTERRPKDDRDVLFYDSRYDDIELGKFMSTQNGWHPMWADVSIASEYVTHWMELPEPPEQT